MIIALQPSACFGFVNGGVLKNDFCIAFHRATGRVCAEPGFMLAGRACWTATCSEGEAMQLAQSLPGVTLINENGEVLFPPQPAPC